MTRKRTGNGRFALLACLALLVSATSVRAQSGRGEITGEVRDASGALVPGAKVTVLDVDTGRPWPATTGPGGLYVMPSLRPGLYRVEVAADGFAPYVREGVQLRTGERVRVDAALSPAGLTETATVTADAPLLKTERSDVGQVIGNRERRPAPLERPQLHRRSWPWSREWPCLPAPSCPG